MHLLTNLATNKSTTEHKKLKNLFEKMDSLHLKLKYGLIKQSFYIKQFPSCFMS